MELLDYQPRYHEFLRRFDEVQGWFHYPFLRVLGVLDRWQRNMAAHGAFCEIGVFHGKSLIALALTRRPAERVVGIDCFDVVENANVSGSGGPVNPATVAANVRAFCPGIPLALLAADSNSLLPPDFPHAPYRMVSIDGDHSAEATCRDLSNAACNSVEHGVVIVDDAENAQWPTVGRGLAQWLAGDPGCHWRPVYVGCNKVVLCRERHHEMLYSVLSREAEGCLSQFEHTHVWRDDVSEGLKLVQ